MTTAVAQTTQVYQLFIRATPEAIWEAITDPAFTEQYFYVAAERGERYSSAPVNLENAIPRAPMYSNPR
jgi:uncharacterized protein YndB with AHSA1/START domain